MYTNVTFQEECQPARAAALLDPIFVPGMLPLDEDVLELSEDDIVSNADESEEFKRRLADFIPKVVFPEDISMRFFAALHVLDEVYQIVGREGILGYVAYIDEFNARIEPMEPPLSPPVHFDPYNEETLPEGFHTLAEARETRNG